MLKGLVQLTLSLKLDYFIQIGCSNTQLDHVQISFGNGTISTDIEYIHYSECHLLTLNKHCKKSAFAKYAINMLNNSKHEIQ